MKYKFKSEDIGKKFYIPGIAGINEEGKDVSIELDYNKIAPSSEVTVLEKNVIASDGSEDRHGETVSSDGWVLKWFKKNPIMLWTHNSSLPAIGTWKGIKVEKGKLLVNPEFDVDQGDSLADMIASKWERGIIRAVSVGFMPLEFDVDFNSIKQELLEISIVNIGANRNALNQGLKKAKEEKRKLQYEEDIVNYMVGKVDRQK